MFQLLFVIFKAHAQPLAVAHSLQSHAPLAVAQQAYVSHAALQPVHQQAYVSHAAVQPVHQQAYVSHAAPVHQQVYAQQVLSHGYAAQQPLAHAQSYSTSSVTNHGVHGAYVH